MFGPSTAAGSGMAQCAVVGLPSHAGQAPWAAFAGAQEQHAADFANDHGLDAPGWVWSLHACLTLDGTASVAGMPQAGLQSLSAKTQQFSVRKPMSSFMRGKLGL